MDMQTFTAPAVPTMPCPGPYLSDEDKVKHMPYIEALARDNGRSIEDVAACYERVLYDLRREARIADYLTVFVAKKVKKELKGMH